MSEMLKWSILLVAALALVGCYPAEEEVAAQCASDMDCAVGSVCEDGACVEAICPDLWDPVCGADGETYSNACEARAAHEEVAHQGECAEVCGGIVGVLCPEGMLCDLPEGFCLGADMEGVCVEIPEMCPEVFDPVCGCDGITYSNDCFRLMAGVQKDHDGECEDGGEL